MYNNMYTYHVSYKVYTHIYIIIHRVKSENSPVYQECLPLLVETIHSRHTLPTNTNKHKGFCN